MSTFSRFLFVTFQEVRRFSCQWPVSAALLTEKQVQMAIFIALGTYTDQGFREIKQTVSRTEDFQLLAKQYGMTVKDVFWMRGQQYDMVTILEGPDCATAQALLLVMNMRGNIRTQLLRAYAAAEIEAFLGAMSATAPGGALGLIASAHTQSAA